MERFQEIWGIYFAHGIEAFLEHVTDDVIVEEYAGVPGAQAWHGRDGFRAMWAKWEDGFDGFLFAPRGETEMIGEEAYATPVRIRGTGRGSGVEVDWNLIMVTVMRDGLIHRQYLVDTIEEARARLR